ncbi:hypothetical protein Tsp_08598 [Trichinella spiralis]|uniref:hypothetical protein n=1 Tax=Trichinella spiralis TaxID=6334 RepID=UPI0001EFD937|nr:hypothetical protein Tsp_08598 [Trichinella spiralis]
MTESNENEKVCDALESIEQQITDKEAKDYLMKQKAIVQNIRASDDILTERQATMQTLIEHQEQINSKMAETYYLLKDKKKHLKMELASLKKEISSRKDAFEHNVNSTVDHVDQLRCARKGLQFAVKYKEKLDAAKEINGKINALKDEIMEQKNYLEQLNISHDKLSAEMANCENCDQDIVVQGQCEQQELGNCDAVDDDNLSVSENGSFGPNFLKNTFSAEKDALQLMEFQNEDNISTGSAVEEFSCDETYFRFEECNCCKECRFVGNDGNSYCWIVN